MTKANFERIQVGMTVQEVEAILGRPPGRTGPHFAGLFMGAREDRAELVSQEEPRRWMNWRVGDDGGFVQITVGLDAQEKVVGASYRWWRWREHPESLVAYLHWLLGLCLVSASSLISGKRMITVACRLAFSARFREKIHQSNNRRVDAR
jgi:hypothetical protein